MIAAPPKINKNKNNDNNNNKFDGPLIIYFSYYL